MPIGAWFGTDFDAPANVLELPVDVTGGQDPGVSIVDQVTRGTGIVGRITGDDGAVALNIRGDGRPVRVSVVVHLDDRATRWWSDRIRPPLGEPERPRVVLLRSQGEVRGAVVLARRQGWLRAGGARATVEFDLTAAELTGADRDGLLVIELAEPKLPPWAAGRFSARGALGLRIDRIQVRPTAPTPPTPAPTASGCPFAVVGPGDATRFRLVVQAVSPAPPVPRSPTTPLTRRKPSRAVFKALRIARRAAGHAAAIPRLPAVTRFGGGSSGEPAVRAVDLVTGSPVDLEIVGRHPGGFDLRLPSPVTAPVLIAVPGTHVSCRVIPAP